MMEVGSIEHLEERLLQLVNASRNGDSKSYNMLLQELLPFIRKNLTNKLSRFGYPQLCEDIAQDVLLAVHLKLPTYDENMPFLAWVRALMRHKIVDALRKQRADMVSIDDENFNEMDLADSSNSESRALAGDLHNLLGQLKPPAGNLIYDMKVKGVAIKELAQKYALTESNVKVIVHRGLNKLASIVATKEN